jgi:hypothetical protein
MLTQPAIAWSTSLAPKKQQAVTPGTLATLLLIRKCDKVAPISPIPLLSADHANAYRIQASNDLSFSSIEYISKLGSTKFIYRAMDKAVAVKLDMLTKTSGKDFSVI